MSVKGESGIEVDLRAATPRISLSRTPNSDAVVAMLALCTISDDRWAIAEAARSL